jgi:hypothetical protein
MPRKTINDYVFYKFVCNDENIKCCYVGSTANFSDRKRKHFSNCNNPNSEKYNLKIYETIRENGGWENWNMVIIGEAKEISLTQSRILEQKYIDELEEKLNMCRAYRSTEDILEYNKKKQKIHYNKYKEKLLEEKKNTYENMNEEKKQLLLENMKINSKNHYEKNKEKITEQHKAYREANKDKINERRRVLRQEKKEEKNNV